MSKYKAYEVTVTPKQTTYAGSWVSGEYTVEVFAESASKAITKARQDRNAEEGRHGVKAAYKARVIQ